MWRRSETLAPAEPEGSQERRPALGSPRRLAAAALLAAAVGLPPIQLPCWPALAGSVPIAAPAAVAALAAAAGGCKGGSLEPERHANIGTEAEWAWLLEAKRQLDAKRAARGGPAAVPSPAAAAAAAPPTAALAASDRLAREIDLRAQQLGRRLVAYINASPPVEGEPLSARQLAALRMKSDEEIAVAHEFIVRSGDYRRACEIYEAALAADPENPRLREELARAREERYMSAERFARAAPGMTAEQVKAVLGPPNAHDVRSDPARGVVGWFYPKDAGGAAAAIWFARRDDVLKVYLCDWSGLPMAPALAVQGPARGAGQKPPAKPAPTAPTAPEPADSGSGLDF
jgi:hypothetical protein